ncbi:MAG: PD-(D/E)XK nuclease family transposase, partial [Spirochaetaceae bacterium]|nr:PD-(D/E)XK nuclease family transposase [Spirochaetaceae bacterium]
HNWASRFLSRMAKGEDYAVLHPVVAIWFLERDLFSDSQWFHSFSLRDSKSGFEFGEDELILTIELAKWVRGDETEVRVRYAPELLESELYLWLYFLTEGQDFDPEALPSSLLGTPVQEAVEAMAIFTKSETARHNYEKRLEMRMERASIEVEEREAGRAEGQRPRALEDARRLKALGVDHGIIAQATDLEIHEIESL